MINVSCAVIRNDDEKVLVVQRGKDSDHPLKWEFPGGKVNPGETFEECIVREINEELSLDIIICASLKNVEHDYTNKRIRLIPFICDTLMDLPVLNEHVAYRWIEASRLAEIDFSEADIPVAEEYMNLSSVKIMELESEANDSEPDLAGIKELLGGKSGFGAIDLLVETAIDNPEVLRELYNFSLGNDSTLAFRAAYSVQKVAESNIDLIRQYLSKIIGSFPSLKNESVIRSFLKIINMAGVRELSEEEHGILADCSFNWLNDGESAIAIKAYSMEALYNLSELYPALAIELVASIRRNMEGGSAGIKARGRMILKRLEKR
jgi:8-oxo-dGTP diphosphatase